MWHQKDEICQVKKLDLPSQQDGGIASLGEIALKGLWDVGKFAARKGLSKAVKSDFAKKKMKDMSSKYIDQVLDSVTSDISKKLDPDKIGSGFDYDMRLYAGDRIHDPTNPLYQRGSAIDIHKLIGKLPKPKSGWTPGNYKYMGPYNPLNKQLEYDKNTGEVTKWHVGPYNKVDEIAAYHDICYDMGKSKGECDKKMVKSLDDIPYGEIPKWGQTARFLINTKQKLGLGVKKPKNVKSRRVKKTGKKN